MDITLIGAPVFYGCDIPGVETAPGKLRQMGLTEVLRRAGHAVEDRGDVAVECGGKHDHHPTMKYVEPIRRMCGELSAGVAEALRAGRFPLVIGGDHSDGIGILSGVAQVYGADAAVLWIDSHSDIHEFATSPSGNVHGVPLGAAIGLPCGDFNALFAPGGHLRGENIFIVGLRSYEPEEERIMERHGVNRFTVDEVRRLGAAAVMAEIAESMRLSGARTLHLSFDIDSLDPSVAPGTGIRVPEGFTGAEGLALVREAFRACPVRSMDISELNPVRDEDERTCRLALQIAGAIPVSLS